MARGIESRLERAARTTRLRRSHCPACKGAQGVAFAFDDGEGDDVPDPAPCARCGRMPLQIVFGFVDYDGQRWRVPDEWREWKYDGKGANDDA